MLILAILLGCEQKSYFYDERPDWHHYVPEHLSSDPYAKSISWSVKSRDSQNNAESEALGLGIGSIESSWESALACGTKINQVQPSQDPDVIFYCETVIDDLEVSDNGLVAVSIDDRGTRHISIESKNCRDSGREFYAYALGKGLGFQGTFSSHKSVMNGASLTDWGIKRDNVVEGEERDGFRIWALRHGAPGCEDGSDWSWKEQPQRFRTYPSEEALKNMISGGSYTPDRTDPTDFLYEIDE